MLSTLKKFFMFCSSEDRNKIYKAIGLGVIKALFAALRIGAIGVVTMGIIDDNMSMKNVWNALIILVISFIVQLIISMKTTMLQTEAGYHCCTSKRIEIAEHLRYLPMGYFNDNSLGHITSVTTNTMEALAGVAARIVMLTTQSVLTTIVLTICVLIFDVRIGLILILGIGIYAVFNSLMQKKARSSVPRKQASDNAMIGAVIEFIQGIVEVKNYNLTKSRAKKLEEAIRAKQFSDTHLEYDVIPYITLQDITTKLIDRKSVV